MTTATDLLPLPEWTKRDDLGGLVPSEVRVEIHAYARANVEHHTAPLQAEIEALMAELDIRDSIIATHAADTREYQKRISQAEARAERLAEALRNSADALERLAFAIRAPNAHTPQLVELAIAMRAAALRDQEEGHEHLP